MNGVRTDFALADILSGSADSWPEAELVALMEIMLGVIERCQEAVLQEDEENRVLIRGVIGHLCGGPGADGSSEVVKRGLARLLGRVLASPDEPFARTALAATTSGQLSGGASGPLSWQRVADHERLADWFYSLARRLRGANARAVEMLRLRFAGLGSREIAERLHLPVRLVRQALADAAGELP